jgi:hypothetical protein
MSTLDNFSQKFFDNYDWSAAADNPTDLVKSGMRYLANAGNMLIDAPSTILSASDELFLQMNYRGALTSRLTREAINQGLTGNDIGQYVENQWSQYFKPDGAGADQGLLKYATNNTFSSDLSDDTVVRAIGKYVQQAHKSDNVGLRVLAKTFFPFVRTPVQIVQDVVDHTPLALIPHTSTLYQDLAAGGAKRAQAIGKLMTGGMMMTAAGLAAQNGYITGQGPSNPELRGQMRKLGWQPYSIQMPDGSWLAYNRFDPYASYFALAADIHEAAHNFSTGESDEAWKNILVSITENVSSKRYLTGMVDLADLMTGASKVTSRTGSSTTWLAHLCRRGRRSAEVTPTPTCARPRLWSTPSATERLVCLNTFPPTATQLDGPLGPLRWVSGFRLRTTRSPRSCSVLKVLGLDLITRLRSMARLTLASSTTLKVRLPMTDGVS